MPCTLFYSWQDDRPRKHHHYLIRDALNGVLKRIPPSEELQLDEAIRLDHDTKSEPGTPEIASTVFAKIKKCSLFVADLTFVGQTVPASCDTASELIPNPNVLVELGYAASRIGWGRIICVMNAAYGKPDEQIFDIKHRRWPISYEVQYVLGENESKLKDARVELEGKLLLAVRSALANEHEQVAEIIASLDVNCLLLIRKYGTAEYFSAPSGFVLGVPQGELDTPSFHRAVERLLSLRVLWCDVAPSQGRYAYHWTYLGKLVCKKLEP